MHDKKILHLLFAFVGWVIQVTYGDTIVHDESFTPDGILHVTTGPQHQACVPDKTILLVNGTSPGPELRFTEGETVWIRVYNDMEDHNLTMHWHGLTMAVAPFSDGTPAASQWPIPPLHFFDYELHVDEGYAGTYFYHSHVGLQAISCTGPLIIQDKHPPHAYDDERMIFLMDVFDAPDDELEHLLSATPIQTEGFQSFVLINGYGGGITVTGEQCNETLPVINVEPDKTYRMRVVGGTGISYDIFAIEGHEKLDIIEADAAYTEPYTTSHMQIGAGQRFSFLLKTLASPAKQQYIIQMTSFERENGTTTYAILNYGPRVDSKDSQFYPPATPPLKLPNTDENWLEYQLTPHGNNGPNSAMHFPKASEVTRRVNITVHLSEPNLHLEYLDNGYTWYEEDPKAPYLVNLYKGDGSNFPSLERAKDNNGIDPFTLAYPAEIGEVLEIVLQNTGSDGGTMETHPWHAHGAHYWDIGSGPGIYNQAENEAKWASSPGHPIKRDTTMLWKNKEFAKPHELSGWRAWRIRIEQPGVWMVHCHLLPHMIFGMQTVWVMGNSSQVLQVDQPDVEGYLNYGGSVYGNKTHPPEVVHYFTNWTQTQ